MVRSRRLLWLIFLAFPQLAQAADCGPGAELTPQELAKHHYLRPQPASCDLAEAQQPRSMWKLIENAATAWPYQYAGQCTPAAGRSYQTYGCLAPEGCAIFLGKDKLRVHVPKAALNCKPGMEP